MEGKYVDPWTYTAQKKEEQFTQLNSSKDLDSLMERIGDSKFVLLGEASHGTHEYYTWRTAISKRLIEEKGFNFIAVEGDWPDCYRLNRYIKDHKGAGETAVDVLKTFNRWPTWMWANWEIVALAEWLKTYNSAKSKEHKIGFYGLDVYSLWESLDELLAYLKKTDPEAVLLAKKAFMCFEPYNREGQEYAKGVITWLESCREEVIDLLKNIRSKALSYNHDPEASLNMEQNAFVIANAEKYYRSMVSFDERSWNIRDRHMADTLNRLMQFHGEKGKAIIWEHNTHVGDARATTMRQSGMFNVGQIIREEHAQEGVYIVGFGSYKGTVIAGSSWGAPMQKISVPEAVEGSIEEILHAEGAEKELLFFNPDKEGDRFLESYPHRAIGVVYHPELEKSGNYVLSQMAKRYDAFIYFDETRALHPLHTQVDTRETPETYPFGL